MSDSPIVVYLAHPFTERPKENVQRVKRIAEKIIDLSQRKRLPCLYAPLVPHLVLSIYSEETNPRIRKVTEALSSVLVQACDELWIVSCHISAGMRLEIETANKIGITVRGWPDVVKLIPELGRESSTR